MTLKTQLRFLLKEEGLSAAQLARKAGVSRQVISDWLAGTSPRQIESVKKVADVLKVTLDELLFGEGEIHRGKQAMPKNLDAIQDSWFTGVFEVKMRRLK